MGNIYNFIKRILTTATPTAVPKNGVSKSSANLAISQYSEFPRFYTINGVKYDIDNPDDIKKIPLFDNILQINGEEYGMDSILLEHSVQASDYDIRWAAYNKTEEFRRNGIIHKSKKEIARDKLHEDAMAERNAREAARNKQCDAFTVEDMQQFSDIPFAWSYVDKLQHTNGTAWFMLNRNNKQIAMHYIAEVNQIVADAAEYIPYIGDNSICIDNLDYDYPHPMYKGCMCQTRVECFPYTASGKLSKYPALLQFATKSNSNGVRAIGTIKILRDGSIGAATFSANSNTFKMGLHGRSLVLQRVDNPYMGGNLFKFSEQYE